MQDYNGMIISSKNLTPDKETGIGSWTEEQFVKALRTGQRPNGKIVRYPMMPYNVLTEKETKAVFAYLKTIPPIQNKIEDTAK